jgi:hypothetical protein
VEEESTRLGLDAMVNPDILAAMIAFAAGVCSSTGINAQKRSHTYNSALPKEKQVYYVWRKDWWLAFSCVILGGLGDFWAFGFGNQALVASMGGATTLVTNVLYAKYWNGEVMLNSDLIGVFCIMCGVVVFALTSPRTQTYTMAELTQHFMSKDFIVYAVIQVVAWLAFFATIGTTTIYQWRVNLTESVLSPVAQRVTDMEKRAHMQIEALQARIQRLEMELDLADFMTSLDTNARVDDNGHETKTSASFYGTAREQENVIDLHVKQDATVHWMDQYIFSACSGTVGALSILFAGCASKMLIAAINGHMPNFWQPETYIFILALVFTVTLQTYLFNYALIMGDVMAIYPVFQAFWILFGVVGGIVFYQSGTVNLAGGALLLVGCRFLVDHGKKNWQGSGVTPVTEEGEQELGEATPRDGEASVAESARLLK